MIYLSSLYHKRSNFDNSDEDKSSTLGVDWSYLLLLPRLEEWRTIICCQVDIEDFYTERHLEFFHNLELTYIGQTLGISEMVTTLLFRIRSSKVFKAVSTFFLTFSIHINVEGNRLLNEKGFTLVFLIYE